MVPLCRIVPDVANLLAMAPSEVANVILESVRRQPNDRAIYHRQEIRFSDPLTQDTQDVQTAISTAWQWMLTNGITFPSDGNNGEWRRFTKDGQALLDNQTFDAGALPIPIPRHLLHASIILHAEPSHLVGRHDQAVLEAFRQLEIATRNKIGADARLHGTDVLKTAFHSATGQLRDPLLPDAERQGEAQLFAGAYMAFRNPAGHRDVGMGRVQAAQLLVLASMLLSIVDSRQVQPQQP